MPADAYAVTRSAAEPVTVVYAEASMAEADSESWVLSADAVTVDTLIIYWCAKGNIFWIDFCQN